MIRALCVCMCVLVYVSARERPPVEHKAEEFLSFSDVKCHDTNIGTTFSYNGVASQLAGKHPYVLCVCVCVV